MLRLAMLLIWTSTYGRPAPLIPVLQGVTGVGKSGRVHDQPVDTFVHALIDAVDRLSLDVRIENVELVAMLLRVSLKHRLELGGSCRCRRSPARADQGTLGWRPARAGSLSSHRPLICQIAPHQHHVPAVALRQANTLPAKACVRARCSDESLLIDRLLLLGGRRIAGQRRYCFRQQHAQQFHRRLALDTGQLGGPGRYLKEPPLICQTGPKTSANSGCSCSMREKRCISGRSLVSGIVGIRS